MSYKENRNNRISFIYFILVLFAVLFCVLKYLLVHLSELKN